MTDITVCGKCEPEPNALSETRERGFENVELYLSKSHIYDKFDVVDAAKACRESDLTIQTVHTPHVSIEDYEHYFTNTARLAEEVNAERVVIHSVGVPLKYATEIEESVQSDVPLAYEANIGEGMFYIKNAVFDTGLDFVFDTAHLFGGEPYYNTEAMTLLTEHKQQIPVVHLSDGTRTNDGVPPGDGELPVEWTIKQLKLRYEGTVVLEVAQDAQEDFLDLWRRTTP